MERRGSPLKDSREKAIKAAKIASSKKARDIIILDLSGITPIADYFVICSGENPTHIKALADAIEENFSKKKITPLGVEGFSLARWVLMDYDDVVIHIFDEETRNYYEVEKLWLDASRITMDELEKHGRGRNRGENLLREKVKDKAVK
ncbi:MAG: ribosome silencing factor [Nitrospirae bacterium]|nr:ribosome silencing factor [Nitrospirota bacterium]